jgi:predicted nucleotidyltransferase
MAIDRASIEAVRLDATETFRQVLRDAVRAVESRGIPYLLMGGVGSAAIGRPRWTHDIDLFVTPQASRLALQALAEDGFKTEETFPHWLFKAFKDDVLVDVIFRSAGDVYLDDEMIERASVRDIDGCSARVMAAEDLIVIKAIVADEHLPRHWHDALGLLAQGGLDWDYLVHRASQHGIRRVCSLLMYAESNDIWVPDAPIRTLFDRLHPNGRSRA